jgi:hypothetical protein
MTTATDHRHKIEFVRQGAEPTRAVCSECGETLLDDVHAWAEAEEAAARGMPRAETIDVTLRELLERRFNSVH